MLWRCSRCRRIRVEIGDDLARVADIRQLAARRFAKAASVRLEGQAGHLQEHHGLRHEGARIGKPPCRRRVSVIIAAVLGFAVSPGLRIAVASAGQMGRKTRRQGIFYAKIAALPSGHRLAPGKSALALSSAGCPACRRSMQMDHGSHPTKIPMTLRVTAAARQDCLQLLAARAHFSPRNGLKTPFIYLLGA